MFPTLLWQPGGGGSRITSPCIKTFGSGSIFMSLVGFICFLVVFCLLAEKNNVASPFPECNSS